MFRKLMHVFVFVLTLTVLAVSLAWAAVCGQCGAKVDDAAKFCGECGAKMAAETAAPQHAGEEQFIFQESFANADALMRMSRMAKQAAIEDGALVIREGLAAWIPDKLPGDYEVRVKVKLLDKNAGFEIWGRIEKHWKAFSFFGVGGERNTVYHRNFTNGAYEDERTFTAPQLDLTGWNRCVLRCVGNQLTLLVNDTVVGSAPCAQLDGGWGLSSSGAGAAFQDLRVVQLPAAAGPPLEAPPAPKPEPQPVPQPAAEAEPQLAPQPATRTEDKPADTPPSAAEVTTEEIPTAPADTDNPTLQETLAWLTTKVSNIGRIFKSFWSNADVSTESEYSEWYTFSFDRDQIIITKKENRRKKLVRNGETEYDESILNNTYSVNLALINPEITVGEYTITDDEYFRYTGDTKGYMISLCTHYEKKSGTYLKLIKLTGETDYHSFGGGQTDYRTHKVIDTIYVSGVSIYLTNKDFAERLVKALKHAVVLSGGVAGEKEPF